VQIATQQDDQSKLVVPIYFNRTMPWRSSDLLWPSFDLLANITGKVIWSTYLIEIADRFAHVGARDQSYGLKLALFPVFP
jgi:hypothetical protein